MASRTCSIGDMGNGVSPGDSPSELSDEVSVSGFWDEFGCVGEDSGDEG